MSDYYELLGVSRGATAEEIKRAYRRRAREFHPDANPDDPQAEARFKELASAYETLVDPAKRQRYDTFGEAGGPAGSPFDSDAGDIFSRLFAEAFGGGTGRTSSGPPRGADIEAVVDLSFEDAVFGTEAPVEVRTAEPCDDCEATGAEPGSSPVRCSDCNGAGQVRRVRQSILGQMVTAAPCQRCGGLGTMIERPCRSCRGEGRQVVEKTYTVEVPAGIDEGQTLRLPGRGASGPRGGGIGDLYVHVRVRPHDRFRREGNRLVGDLTVAMTQASLGAQMAIETLDGIEEIDIPPGTTSGEVIVLRGLGVPNVERRGRGDMLLEVVVETPEAENEEQEELLRRLAELRGEAVADPDSGLFSRLRSAFR